MPPYMSAANGVLRLGSVQVGVGAGWQDGSGAWEKFTSSACAPRPSSAGAVPLLGELFAVVVPAMFPEAISWRTSLGVIGHGLPSTFRQSPAGESLPVAIAFFAAL